MAGVKGQHAAWKLGEVTTRTPLSTVRLVEGDGAARRGRARRPALPTCHAVHARARIRAAGGGSIGSELVLDNLSWPESKADEEAVDWLILFYYYCRLRWSRRICGRLVHRRLDLLVESIRF